MMSIPLVEGPGLLVYIPNFLATAYDALRSAVGILLKGTVFKANPQPATRYAEGVSILVALTAVYMILEFVSSAKAIVRTVLVLGWVLLIVAMIITGYYSP